MMKIHTSICLSLERIRLVGTYCFLAMLVYGCKHKALEENPQKQEAHSSNQHNYQVANPQELLEEKLRNPARELEPIEGAALIHHCAELGERSAVLTTGKEAIVVLGIAGVGKSTFLNYLLGCSMQTGLDRFEEEIIVVDSGSNLREVMSIGHSMHSQTLMPQIALDSDDPNVAYCDCPGFREDNRGSEINIANSINIKQIFQHATSIKVVLLAEYKDLLTRDLTIRSLGNMCQRIFGGEEGLRRYQNSVLLGITKAPFYNISGQPLSLNTVRARITEVGTPIAQILANRTFLFDPLDRAVENPDFWPIERCRTEISQLASIPQQEATELFQTALTSGDEAKLQHIVSSQVTALVDALAQDDYPTAGRHWQSLTSLRVIDNDEVGRMIREHVLPEARRHVLGCAHAFEQCVSQHQFGQAARQLALLRMLTSHFPNADLQVNLAALEPLLTQCKERQAEEQSNTDESLAAAKLAAVQQARQEIERNIRPILSQLEDMP